MEAIGERKDLKDLARQVAAAYPRRNGVDLSFRLPQPKGRILLVDDDANNARGELESIPVTRRRDVSLSDLYHIDPVEVRAGAARAQAGDYAACCGRLLRKKLTELPVDIHAYDLILLDLCLGEARDEEPLGYQLLPILRKFFPLVPIVVYTKFRDMGHIVRAFRRGATWFLPKEDAGKLPAHHLEMIDNPHWESEWNAVKGRIHWDLPVGIDLNQPQRHLVWKTVEHMPGGRIFVRELRGGIGGAKTLHASREINGRYDRSAPVVIKIDNAFDMLLERERYQRFIQPYLSNLAGRIDVPLHLGGGNLGAISYTYAGGSQGRRGDHRQVMTLGDILNLNLPGEGHDILPAGKFERLMKALFGEVLGRIHRIDPRPEPSEIDFPNLVLGESPSPQPLSSDNPEGSPLDAYLTRMPPWSEVRLEEPLGLDGDGETKVYLYTVEARDEKKREPGHLKCLLSHEGLLHRVDLRGTLGDFYANHRYFRPMQPLWVKAKIDPEEEYFANQWSGLWTDSGNGCNFREASPTIDTTKAKALVYTFPSCRLSELIGGPSPQAAVCNLIEWLTEKRSPPRKALENGRVGIIHGDMNLGNVMVERERSQGPMPVNSPPWLIDFARTRRDWIVVDYTQLELDLCMQLIRPEFFPSLRKENSEQDWTDPDSFVSHFLRTPWQSPPCLKHDPRAEFVYNLMRQTREAAEHRGIRDGEYLASRIWQCLIIHKILCGKWRKDKEDTDDPVLQFRCVWTLRQVFQTAKLLGWKGVS